MTNESANANVDDLAGARCLAGPGGAWHQATIRRVNEDGTFTIEPDEKPSLLMPYWYGVPRSEISFDDDRQWNQVWPRVSNDRGRMDEAAFASLLRAVGFVASDEQLHQHWSTSCGKLFGIPKERAKTAVLDANEAYSLCLSTGISGRQIRDKLDRPSAAETYHTIYWNMTRMGGRDPAEVQRPVTLQDALDAVGASDRIDGSAVARMRAIEQSHSLVLPETLKTLFQRRGIDEAIHESHPNNPDPAAARQYGWEPEQSLRKSGLQGDIAVTIMFPHQGDHEWAAVFDSGDPDARIYLRWDDDTGPHWQLTAPTVAMFFWDLAQTGLAWYRERGIKGPPSRETDIGLAVAR